MNGERKLFLWQLDALRAGEPPLRLTRGQAEAHAARLHGAGLSYAGVSVVMELYHGHGKTGEQWRYATRRREEVL